MQYFHTLSWVLIIILAIVFSSCRGDYQNTSANLGQSRCTVDTSNLIKIPNKDIIQGMYRYAQYAESENLFIGYNHFNNSLECIDLASLKLIKIIPFSKEGPTAMSDPKSFYYYNHDSIFVLGSYKLALLNDKGEVYFIENINRAGSKLKGLDFSQFSIYNDPNNNQPIYFNSNDKKLYFAIKSFGSSHSDAYYQNPLCGRLNLLNFEIETLPVYYSEEFKKSNVFYPLDKPNILFMDDRIIYSFKNKSDIYEFNINTQATTLHKCPSSYTANTVNPLSNNQKGDDFAIMKHLSSNPEYKFIRFDPYTKLYYRFHFGPYPYLDEPNAIGKRGYLYLSFIDTAFKVQHEEQLSLNYRYFGTTPTPLGLLIKTKDQDEMHNTYTAFRYICN